MSKAKIWLDVTCGCCGCTTAKSRFYRNQDDIRVVKLAVKDWEYTNDYGNTCPECLEKMKGSQK